MMCVGGPRARIHPVITNQIVVRTLRRDTHSSPLLRRSPFPRKLKCSLSREPWRDEDSQKEPGGQCDVAATEGYKSASLKKEHVQTLSALQKKNTSRQTLTHVSRTQQRGIHRQDDTLTGQVVDVLSRAYDELHSVMTRLTIHTGHNYLPQR